MKATKESVLNNITLFKHRDYKGDIGEAAIWDESKENIQTTMCGGACFGDVRETTSGLYLGRIMFNPTNVTPKMAKEIIKIINKGLSTIGHNKANDKIGTIIIPN